MPFYHCSENLAEMNHRWDECVTLDDFLQCIPLKVGVLIVAICGILYGFIGVFLFLSIILHFYDYTIVYIKKRDLLIYLMIIFGMISKIFVASIFLLWGVSFQEDWPVFVFLWIAILHVFLIWLVTISMCSYCAFSNISCFQGSGIGMVLTSLVGTVFYSAFWIYIIIAVNSYRIHG